MAKTHIRNALRERALAYEAEHLDVNERTIAKRIVSAMSEEGLRELAIETVMDWIWSARRNRQLDVELAAQREETERALELKRQQDTAAQVLKFERVFKDPLLLARGGYSGGVIMSAEESDKFKLWCGDARYEEWNQRAHAVIREQPEDNNRLSLGREMFFENFHPGGRAAYRQTQKEKFEEERYKMLHTLIKDYTQTIRLELTEELLGSIFALGDGRRVTWGEATRAEHEQRIDMLAKNANANAAAAARHVAAVSMIEEAGVERLADIPVEDRKPAEVV
jgi:hypothetical protein